MFLYININYKIKRHFFKCKAATYDRGVQYRAAQSAYAHPVHRMMRLKQQSQRAALRIEKFKLKAQKERDIDV